MTMNNAWGLMRSMSSNETTRAPLPPGTARRVLGYARPFSRVIAGFLVLVAVGSVTVVAVPLLLQRLIDDGVIPQERGVVVTISLLVALIALVEGVTTLVQRWLSARIGEGLIHHLRTEVFAHVLRQPIAFFTRAQTGALVSRLNNDVIGAQQAFTTVLSSVVSNVISLVLILGAMFALSWQLTLAALVLVPFFILPAKWMGRRLASLSSEQMNLNADLGNQMTERFNVAGALLVKIFGQPSLEVTQYDQRAARVRDIGVRIAVNRAVFFVMLTLLASLATAMVYGFGGIMAVEGTLTVGTLLALAALLARLYGPLTAISNVHIDILTALVSFARLFELLDMPSSIQEKPDAQPLPTGEALSVEMDDVHFTYPGADSISLRSLEGTTTGDREEGGPVLQGVSLRAEPGQLIALVGPSGAGKSTITSLVTRFYDPTGGAVRIGGRDLRDATLESVSATVGMVTQEAHLFHDTLRANLAYARPEATEAEMWEALESARIGHLVHTLPAGLDTVVGDRGHRLSGGEKQRFAIARLLLKSPAVLILDEATAHLDSESEVAVQRALDAALEGRTAIVIAHRLSTIRAADQILVVDDGRVVERGTHEELLAAAGLYATLYATQYDGGVSQDAAEVTG
ncbi:ABC transporter [Janibacter sp. Soil728]|uniref:ABC transporter ATP-binding protein n=1 Tax=Janibacter sp. Soil728 TaxID=1736393 RepID=UPI0006F688D0|nr:ABC transporter ATP-binding protein [Janibacter sp. Soil728]KRE37107.1 ABC transporter [Janibacter sp. Soil728]